MGSQTPREHDARFRIFTGFSPERAIDNLACFRLARRQPLFLQVRDVRHGGTFESRGHVDLIQAVTKGVVRFEGWFRGVNGCGKELARVRIEDYTLWNRRGNLVVVSEPYTRSLCSNCATTLEQQWRFCPQCGEGRTDTR